jgi:hypothetical protein
MDALFRPIFETSFLCLWHSELSTCTYAASLLHPSTLFSKVSRDTHCEDRIRFSPDRNNVKNARRVFRSLERIMERSPSCQLLQTDCDLGDEI